MAKLTPNHYKIILRDISEGRGEAFEAFVPAFHAFNFGDTVEEALETYHIYFKDEAKRRAKLGIPMPKSDVTEEKIKQVPLRIPMNVFEKIASMSKDSGLSFNGFVTRTLENLA
jgi:hypothetical protein